MPPAQSSNIWLRILENNGPMAIGLVAMGWAFWAFQLVPNAAERTAFVSVLTTTATTNAAAYVKVADNIEEQSGVLVGIHEEVASQTALRNVAMDTMTAFASEMRDCMDDVKSSTMTEETREQLLAFMLEIQKTHPDQMELLEEILAEIKSKPNGYMDKLDILIENTKKPE